MKLKYKLNKKQRRHSHVCPCNENVKTQTEFYSGILDKLGQGNTALRKRILKSSDPCFIRYLSRCAHGVLSSHIKLPKKEYSRLNGSKPLLLKLVSKSKSITKKRKLLQDQIGGGFFSLLGGIAAAVIGNLINKAI
jgi:hypothetical protein